MRCSKLFMGILTTMVIAPALLAAPAEVTTYQGQLK